ncbi:coniferyl aldehyde dehydrogenase [Pseudoalteromonas phenolica O-BC30]|nr:coniferyl aldehyde dehydrogenase [Pseudoalteromonas phenolica O-BC30]
MSHVVQYEIDPQLTKQLESLKVAFMHHPNSSVETRISLLKKIRTQLVTAEQDFIAASNKDFGNRCTFDTQMADFMPVIGGIDHIIKHLNSWLKPSRRKVGLQFAFSSAHINYVPKGVVGVISPWNYPIQLALMPIITALAAGNRVMLKLSEYTPATNQLIKEILEPFSDYCCVIEGGPVVAKSFSALPFDHLFFTGSTEIGKHVMRAAANNLVPVTLELGGKSPVVVMDDADIKHAARSIVFGKTANAGQICVAPDYLVVHEKCKTELIEEIKKQYKKHFKTGSNLDNLTSIVNQQQYERLIELIGDALHDGAYVWSEPNSENFETRKLGLHLIDNASNRARVHQEEIFGPLLPIKSVSSFDEVIKVIKHNPNPLATYLFTKNKVLVNRAEREIQCGGLVINDVLLHVAVEDLPFGGIGSSGMGQYHGKEGILTFSHAKSVFKSGRLGNPRMQLLLSRSKLLTWFVKTLQK